MAHLEEQNCGQTSSKLAEGEKLVCHPCDNAGHATHAVRTLYRARIFKLLWSPRIDSKEENPIPTRFLASIDCFSIPALEVFGLWKSATGQGVFVLICNSFLKAYY